MREEMKVMVTVRLVGNNGNVDIEDVVATGARDLLSKVELEKDFYHCPRKEHNYWMDEEKKWEWEFKRGKKRYEWTKRDAYLEPCQECGKELTIFDEYHRRYGTCNSTCYLHLVGMSWSDFI